MTGLSLILQCMLAGVLVVLALLSVQLVALALRAPFPRRAARAHAAPARRSAARRAGAAAGLRRRRRSPCVSPPPPRGSTGRATSSRSRCSTMAAPANHEALVARDRERHSGRRRISRSCAAASAPASRPAISPSASSIRDAPYVAIFDADFVPPTDFLAPHRAGAGRRLRSCLRAGALGPCQPHQELADARAGHAARRAFRGRAGRRASAPACRSRSTARPACGAARRSTMAAAGPATR